MTDDGEKMIDRAIDRPLDADDRLGAQVVTSNQLSAGLEGERMKKMAVMAADGIETDALVGVIARRGTKASGVSG